MFIKKWSIFGDNFIKISLLSNNSQLVSLNYQFCDLCFCRNMFLTRNKKSGKSSTVSGTIQQHEQRAFKAPDWEVCNLITPLCRGGQKGAVECVCVCGMRVDFEWVLFIFHHLFSRNFCSKTLWNVCHGFVSLWKRRPRTWFCKFLTFSHMNWVFFQTNWVFRSK